MKSCEEGSVHQEHVRSHLGTLLAEQNIYFWKSPMTKLCCAIRHALLVALLQCPCTRIDRIVSSRQHHKNGLNSNHAKQHVKWYCISYSFTVNIVLLWRWPYDVLNFSVSADNSYFGKYWWTLCVQTSNNRYRYMHFTNVSGDCRTTLICIRWGQFSNKLEQAFYGHHSSVVLNRLRSAHKCIHCRALYAAKLLVHGYVYSQCTGCTRFLIIFIYKPRMNI